MKQELAVFAPVIRGGLPNVANMRFLQAKRRREGFFQRKASPASAGEHIGPSHSVARCGADRATLHEVIAAYINEAGDRWRREIRRRWGAPIAINPLCYLLKGSFGRIIASVQMSFEWTVHLASNLALTR